MSSPFATAGSVAPPPAAESSSRVQSNRVYAIVLALVALVGITIVLAVWILPGGKKEDRSDAAAPVVVTTTNAAPSPAPAKVRDTGSAHPPDGPPKPPKTTHNTPAGGGSTSTATPSQPRVSAGTLAVVMADTAGLTGVEVVCPSNYRNRASFSGGRAVLSNVPSEPCGLFFKGAISAQFAPVTGGRSYNCKITGTTAVCQ